MTIEDYPIPVRPFAVMEARIQAALETGKLLDGVTYDREATVQHMGADLLPLIQPSEFTLEEAIFAGRSRTPGLQGNTQLVSNGVISFFVAARREYGFARRSQSDTEDGRGVFEWASILQDVIETHVGGGPVDEETEEPTDIEDAFLLGTLARPISFRVRENFISDLSFIVILECTVMTVPYWRAGRRN